MVAEYETSGLGREEFCLKHGLALSTLARYRRRRQPAEAEAGNPSRWVAVELTASPQAASGLAVVVAGGRRIAVSRGFDADTLAQLMGLLEPA